MPRHPVVRVAGMVLAGVAFAAVVGLVLGWVVMALWNRLMPDIFGLSTISYWQAVGLFILAHLLLKGGGPFGHKHDHHNSKHAVFKEKLRAKFCQDTESEPEAEVESPRQENDT